MKKKSIALEFGENMFGKLKPELKNILQNVIDFPSQETWNRAYTVILTNKNDKMISLWQAVIKIDSSFNISKKIGEKWSRIPSSKIIKKAINNVVFENESKEGLN